MSKLQAVLVYNQSRFVVHIVGVTAVSVLLSVIVEGSSPETRICTRVATVRLDHRRKQ
jgi:hypothetical protein